MAETDNEQKTEQASEKRMNEAFARGQFAKTPELSVFVLMAATLGVIGFTAQSSSREVAEYSINCFTHFSTIELRSDTVVTQLADAMLVIGKVVGPVMLACTSAALISGGIQSGFRLTPDVLEMNFDRLNPMNGWGKIISKASIVHAGIDSLKLAAIGYTLYLGAKNLMQDPLFSAPIETAYLGRFMTQAAIEFFSRMLFAIGVIAAISFGYEKFKVTKELMMTRDEVKDERKSSEGSGETKGARRRLSRRLMQKQMLAAVRTADVIVTNPTHYAVALKYERGKDKAPVVLAKGENRFAMRIKALAAEHGVPTVENRPVARVLYAMGTVGESIPAELYQAVAEILAVVYRTHRYYFHSLKARRMQEAV